MFAQSYSTFSAGQESELAHTSEYLIFQFNYLIANYLTNPTWPRLITTETWPTFNHGLKTTSKSL